MSLGVKIGQSIRMTTLPTTVSNCLENVGAWTFHNPMGLHALFQGLLYLFYLLVRSVPVCATLRTDTPQGRVFAGVTREPN
jgi:hypothetical protein